MELPQKLSPSSEKKYRSLFTGLKKRKSGKDDILFEEAHDEVFENINCLDCANCCKTHSPLFTEKDITRISAHFKMRPAEFASKYLVIDEDGDYVFPASPCPFLGNDNRCSIYSIRPNACAEYPHTNRKKIYQIEEITLKNAEICPAVTKILDKVEIAIKS